MGSSSCNNCRFNHQGLKKIPQTGIVSGDSSMELTSALFLESTKMLTLPLTSSALTLTVTAT